MSSPESAWRFIERLEREERAPAPSGPVAVEVVFGPTVGHREGPSMSTRSKAKVPPSVAVDVQADIDDAIRRRDLGSLRNFADEARASGLDQLAAGRTRSCRCWRPRRPRQAATSCSGSRARWSHPSPRRPNSPRRSTG
jgi:hypothetical protein